MKAKVSFDVKPWNGWSEKQPQGDVLDHTILSGNTFLITLKDLIKMLGLQSSDLDDGAFTIDFKNPPHIKLSYRGFVVKEGERTNLNAQKEGEVDLQIGQAVKFATPTMDAGTNINITLEEIQ